MNVTNVSISPTADITNASANNDSSSFASFGPTNGAWILINGFIVFTMQMGFAYVEQGSVSLNTETSTMFKNAIDAMFGGWGYWLFGYAFAFGTTRYPNPFIGLDGFFVDVYDPLTMGNTYANFFYQVTFTTTAAGIVAGSMSERVRIQAYMWYSFFNNINYSIIQHWIWADIGWLKQLGVVDISGSGVVHLCGGSSALMAALVLGPRRNRWKPDWRMMPPGSNFNMVYGIMFLWFGWMSFNASSAAFYMEGNNWKAAARATVVTYVAGSCGGFAGVFWSAITTRSKIFSPTELAIGVLGGLVATTAPCGVITCWEACIIGFIGGFLPQIAMRVLDRLHIDDAVYATALHFVDGIWGVLSVGLFMNDQEFIGYAALNGLRHNVGLFHGGGWYPLGVQALLCVCVIAWSMLCTFLVLTIMKYTIGIRLTDEEEAMGTDLAQHGVHLPYVPYSYKASLDQLLLEREQQLKEQQRLNDPDIFARDDTDYWADSFSVDSQKYHYGFNKTSP